MKIVNATFDFKTVEAKLLFESNVVEPMYEGVFRERTEDKSPVIVSSTGNMMTVHILNSREASVLRSEVKKAFGSREQQSKAFAFSFNRN
jgi:hypothetical protein